MSKHAMRLKHPCGSCPFLKEGGVQLREGRLRGIVENALGDDSQTFVCHKTIDYSDEERQNSDGTYVMHSDSEQCAGFSIMLSKLGRPNLRMRLAAAIGITAPDQYEQYYDKVLEPSDIFGEGYNHE